MKKDISNFELMFVGQLAIRSIAKINGWYHETHELKSMDWNTCLKLQQDAMRELQKELKV